MFLAMNKIASALLLTLYSAQAMNIPFRDEPSSAYFNTPGTAVIMGDNSVADVNSGILTLDKDNGRRWQSLATGHLYRIALASKIFSETRKVTICDTFQRELGHIKADYGDVAQSSRNDNLMAILTTAGNLELYDLETCKCFFRDASRFEIAANFPLGRHRSNGYLAFTTDDRWLIAARHTLISIYSLTPGSPVKVRTSTQPYPVTGLASSSINPTEYMFCDAEKTDVSIGSAQNRFQHKRTLVDYDSDDELDDSVEDIFYTADGTPYAVLDDDNYESVLTRERLEDYERGMDASRLKCDINMLQRLYQRNFHARHGYSYRIKTLNDFNTTYISSTPCGGYCPATNQILQRTSDGRALRVISLDDLERVKDDDCE